MSRLFALAVAALLAIPASSRAAEDMLQLPLLVRLRTVYISPANQSDANASAGLAKDAIHVSGKMIPEVDFTYVMNEFFSAELILTYPQEHDVKLDGNKVGTFSHLPPVLTLQASYPYKMFRPYVGAGVNFTWITEQNIASHAVKLDTTSFGFAAQVGFDVEVMKHVSLNADVKYVTLGLDLNDSSGNKVTSLGVNPWLFGAGLAYRF
jgi:outer membrane protein